MMIFDIVCKIITTCASIVSIIKTVAEVHTSDHDEKRK